MEVSQGMLRGLLEDVEKMLLGRFVLDCCFLCDSCSLHTIQGKF